MNIRVSTLFKEVIYFIKEVGYLFIVWIAGIVALQPGKCNGICLTMCNNFIQQNYV